MFANCFIPDYALGDREYTPWVLTHEDWHKLDPVVIQELFDELLEQYSSEEPDILDILYEHLEGLGYGTYQHYSEPIILAFP